MKTSWLEIVVAGLVSALTAALTILLKEWVARGARKETIQVQFADSLQRALAANTTVEAMLRGEVDRMRERLDKGDVENDALRAENRKIREECEEDRRLLKTAERRAEEMGGQLSIAQASLAAALLELNAAREELKAASGKGA